MRLRPLLTLAFLLLLVIPAASAQMGGGRMPGMGNRGGVMPMGGLLSSNMMELPVAPDGTVFVLKKGTSGYDMAAISSTGTVRWTYPLATNGMGFAAIAGNTLVLTSIQTSMMNTNFTFTSELVGVSVTSGTKLWSLDLSGGVPMGITPYSDGFYVVTFNALPTFTRKLIAVGSDGKQKWSLNLD